MDFISEADVNNVIFPENLPFVGGSCLFNLLQGGGCNTDDNRDIGPDGVTSDWWFYFSSTPDSVGLFAE